MADQSVQPADTVAMHERACRYSGLDRSRAVNADDCCCNPLRLADYERLLNEPIPLGNEMAALLTVVTTLRYLPPDLHEKATSLARRWAARYDRSGA